MPHFAIGCVEFVPLKIGTPYRIIWSQTGTQAQDCCPELPFEKHVRTSSTNSPLMLASFFFSSTSYASYSLNVKRSPITFLSVSVAVFVCGFLFLFFCKLWVARFVCFVYGFVLFPFCFICIFSDFQSDGRSFFLDSIFWTLCLFSYLVLFCFMVLLYCILDKHTH